MKQVGIFGKRKSGKSALMYALTHHKMMQETKYNSMEISGAEKIMLVDTVGVDVEQSGAEKSAESMDVAIMLISNDYFDLEMAWLSKLRKIGVKIILVISQADKFSDGGKSLAAAVNEVSGLKTICVSAKNGIGIDELNQEILKNLIKTES